MITFERSFDYELIRAVLIHPRIWPHISDDNSPARLDYRPIESDAVWYVLAWDDDELLGLWMLHPQNSICWEIHTALLPNAWGERGRIAALAMAEWIWEHTVCKRIVTNVPRQNRLALRFALDAGMKIFGVNRESYLKNGQLCDQICLGLSCPSNKRPRAGVQSLQDAISVGGPPTETGESLSGELYALAAAPASPGERNAGPEKGTAEIVRPQCV